MDSGKGVGFDFVGIENLLDIREVNQGNGCSHYGLLRMSDKLQFVDCRFRSGLPLAWSGIGPTLGARDRFDKLKSLPDF
jgi:hypothetical protein